MIAILAWATLAVCGITTLARVPSALRGENRSLFGIFLFATVAVALSLDAIYTTVDPWLGSENYANLILRFVVYSVVLLAGYRTAKAFDAPQSVRLIRGPVGLGVLALVGTATVALFLLADTTGTVTGLTSLPGRSPSNAVLIEWYAAAGRLYPSYIAACILPATYRAIGRRLPTAIRAGAMLLTVGFACMALASFFPLIPAEAGFIKFLINYASVLCLITGLTLVWISSLRAKRKTRQKTRLLETSTNGIHKIIRM